jgi:hypothetical protein
MEFTIDNTPPPKLIYQDINGSSPHWRQRNRIYHPLTQHQFANKFRVGDRVKMRVSYPGTKSYINATILNISDYYTSQQWIGSYNIDDGFKGAMFTHVLILAP